MIYKSLWLDFLPLFSMIRYYMQYILLPILSFLAHLIISRHRPYIIGVTGTVGKTTITTHIAQFLIEEYGNKNVGYSLYHYNGEYGLPLTIIGCRTPGRNPFLWIWVFIVAISRLVYSYPRYLVLEYGIDHPGEMQFLLHIAIPDIAIITPVEPNHIEQFGSLEVYRSNKLMIIEDATHRIVHESLRQYIDLDTLYYSLGALSDIDAAHIEMDIWGTRAVVQYNKKQYPITLPAIGTFQIENLLPLYPIADILHIDPTHIANYAAHGSPEAGRSSILSWVHNSTIIDGSYNGWYLSIREWIVSMRSFLHSHHIIFLIWDMRELWDMSKSLHEQLAHDICDIIPHESSVSFYLVGPMMREYVAPILSPHFHTLSNLSSRESGKQIRDDLTHKKINTIIYAKWSQNTIFIEEGIKLLLADPLDVKKLPRQTLHWREKKDIFFKSLKQ